MLKRMKASLIFLFLGTFSAMIYGETKTIVLQNGLDGYSGCRDSYMESNSGLAATEPKGTETKLKFAEWFAWSKAFARVAIAFDLPEDVSGVTVSEAKLSIYFNGGTPLDILTAFRLTQDWVEDELTWDNAATDLPWETAWDTPPNPIEAGNGVPPGGMTEVLDSAKAECGPVIPLDWESFDVTSIIQKFIDGTPNYGFLIRADDKMGGTDRYYVSSEYEDDTTLRPKLEITYESGSNPISYNKVSNSGIVSKFETASNISLFFRNHSKYEVTLSTLSGKIVQSFKGNGNNALVIEKSSLNSSCYLMSVKIDGLFFKTERLMIIK